MSFAGIRNVLVVSCLLAVHGLAGRGLAQTRDNDSQTSSVVEWHQRVLKGSSSASSAAEETPAAVYHSQPTTSGVQPVSYNEPSYSRSYAPSSYTQPSTGTSAGSWQTRGRATVSAGSLASRQRILRTSGEEEVIEPGPIVGAAPTPEPIPSVTQGQPQYEPMPTMGVMDETGDCVGDACEPGCVSDCGDGRCRDDYGYECFDGRINCWWIRDLSINVGVEGFKGPRDLNQNGNFGFHEGLDLAGPVGDPWNIGYQVGVNFEQSDLSGTPAVSDIQASSRRQTFVTTSLFRRANCSGLQGGIAYDYLSDVYGGDLNLQQLRFEVSYLVRDRWEFGYYGACSLNSSTFSDANENTVRMKSTDMYTFFVRRYFDNGGDGRIWGGATSDGDGLLGASVWLPVGKHLALENTATYLVPNGDTHEASQQRESWGLSVSLVWYPGRIATAQQHNPYRPLFDTANNATFMSHRVDH
jgi:hypothetical protein